MSIVGAYRLLDQISIYPSGKTEHPRGEQPTGLLLYTADGRMSVHLLRSDRAVSGSFNSLETALNEYLGYYGTYVVNEATKTITHHVEGSSFPSWIGTDLVRGFEWDGERLILRAEMGSTTRILTWQRISRG
ncbi:MAG: lipocalin-like domain-containing protein [Anaerolineae bacterium]|uniref:lipocalin-like domain-containing protein n=1 Tax=Candidatus Flexifilum breve TaxID=3140694 RepID=UPI001AC88B08|nr:lipocalin-like domain-containing protein [Chloroflexota bacterium]MBN8636171.1 lipocalin-like domain-containing protein [Anaerolineae bacterium]